MTTTRYLCPLDCGWHHDHALGTQPSPQVTITPEMTLDDIVDATTFAHMQLEVEQVETVVRTHLESHELVEWVTALATARQQLADEKARQEAYEESIVGALNERNTRDCSRVDQAEAERDRYAALLVEASEALRTVGRAAIAVEPFLTKPFTDVPNTSPWERFMEQPSKRAYNLGTRIRRELNQASKEQP